MSDEPDNVDHDSAPPRLVAKAAALVALAHHRSDEIECPSAEQIAAYAANALDGDEAQAVGSAIARCDRCYRLWRDALAWEDDEDTATNVVSLRRPPPPPASPSTSSSPTVKPPLRALAAAVGLLAIGVTVIQFSGEPVTLPPYSTSLRPELSVRGGEPGANADEAITIMVREGARFEVVFRPPEPVREAVAAAAYTIGANNDWTPLIAPVSISPVGVVVYEGTVGEDVLVPRTATALAVVVAPVDALPGVSKLSRRFQAPGRGTLGSAQVWRFSLDHGETLLPSRIAPPPERVVRSLSDDTEGAPSSTRQRPAAPSMVDADLRPSDTWQVTYGGCATVLSGPRCVLDEDRELTLWFPSDLYTESVVKSRNRAVPVRAKKRVGAGEQWVVRVPRGARELSLRTVHAAQARQWSLAFSDDQTPAELRRVQSFVAKAEYEAMAEYINEVLVSPDVPRRGALLGYLGRYQQFVGEAEVARDNLTSAMTLEFEEGRWLEALRVANVLSSLLQKQARDLAAAAEVYERFEALASAPAEGVYFQQYNRGLIALNGEDARGVFAHLPQAAAIARRMSTGPDDAWAARQLYAEQSLAVQLQRVGLFEQAERYLSAWQTRGVPASVRSCRLALFHTNLGWTRAIARDAGLTAADPLPAFTAADALFEAAKCQPEDEANSKMNLALAHLQSGDAARAGEALEQMREILPNPTLRLRLWDADLQARVALATGDHSRALSELAALAQVGELTASPDAVWRAAVGRGQVYEALAQPERALAAYAEADALLDGELSRVPFFAGLPHFVAMRRQAALRRVRLLLVDGDIEAAYAVARRMHQRARSHVSWMERAPDEASAEHTAALEAYRVLRQQVSAELVTGWRMLEQERDELLRRAPELRASLLRVLDTSPPPRVATLPTAADLALAPDDALLLTVPLSEREWVTFLRQDGQLEAALRLCQGGASKSEIVAQCLLPPLGESLRRAKRLVVVSNGSLDDVDVHALTLAGDDRMLAEQLPVAYSLDLSRGNGSLALADGEALLVAVSAFTTSAPLRAAPDEINAVAELLEQVPQVEAQRWFEPVVYDRLRERLGTAQLFHFAGHAEAEPQRPWQSALGLSYDTVLTAADVIALPSVPKQVVLSACGTAVSASGASRSSVGLAQAFLLRGAEMAVATSRVVDDVTAKNLMMSFYEHWAGGETADVALANAQRALRVADASSDWAAFRLLVP